MKRFGADILSSSVLFLIAGTLTGFTQTSISLRALTEHAAELSHTGIAGETYGIERTATIGNSGWELVATSRELAPGQFQFNDDIALFQLMRFYRVSRGESPSVLDWIENYPLAYLDGQEADALPAFRWNPFPQAGTAYRFEIFETIPDGFGGHTPLTQPLVSVSGLIAPEYVMQPPEPPLGIEVTYAYVVTAEPIDLQSRRVRGRPVLLTGFGKNGATEGPLFPPPPFFSASEPGAVTNWGALLRMLNELAEKKAEIARAISNNPFVEEIELIKQLANILKNPSSITNALNGILNDPTSLTDGEATLKALCYLESVLEFVLLYDANMKAATREKLKRYHEKLEAIKKRLEEAQDRQSKLPEIIEELKGLKDEFDDEAGDPLGYIARLLKDKLLDKLQEMLAKKLGAKAAGAIISIIADLINFGDLLVQLGRLDSLCEQYNALLLRGIANDPAGATEPGRRFTSKVPEDRLDCTTITLAYKKMCWKPKPGGGANEGDWGVSDVAYDDGTTSKTRRAADIQTGTAPDGRICVELQTVLDPASLVCPAGEGPCIVFAEVTHKCDSPRSEYTVRLFAGVIRCP